MQANSQEVTILYTSGAIKLSTVRSVAKAVKKQLLNDRYPPVKKVVLFNPPGVDPGQMLVYREIFGSIPIDDVPLQEGGLADSQIFTEAFKQEGVKHIDLTNGQKTTAAQLYLAASLLGIDRIFYLSLNKPANELQEDPLVGRDYTYIKIPKFSQVYNLARLSYFDLIYYLEEVERVFIEITNQGLLSRTKRDICKAVTTFFKEDSYRSAISDATTFVEPTINTLLSFLKTYPKSKNFSQSYNVDLDRQRDPVGAVSYFFKQYAEYGGGDSNLDVLVAVPGLLSALRSFRNLSAHSGCFPRDFQNNEARVTINMAIECLRCMRSSNAFWEILRRK